jgi:hypothetical protein
MKSVHDFQKNITFPTYFRILRKRTDIIDQLNFQNSIGCIARTFADAYIRRKSASGQLICHGKLNHEIANDGIVILPYITYNSTT